jgi:hypothetical protein
MPSKTNRAFRATTPIARDSVQAHLDQLIDKAFAGPLAISRIAQLMRGTPQDYARLGNLPPVVEGTMLEQAITLLAASNPDVMVFAGHPLPVSEASFERVRVTLGGNLHSTPAMSAGTRPKGYEPDLVLIDPQSGIAHLLDIKRNLNSYDAPRLSHLKHRMFAAAYSLPDLAASSSTRVTVTEIRVALLNIEASRQDVGKGIWSVAGLDQLIGVPGAAAMITRMRSTFARRVSAQFAAALQSLIEDAVRERLSSAGGAELPLAEGGSDPGDPANRLIVGFARLPEEDESS